MIFENAKHLAEERAGRRHATTPSTDVKSFSRQMKTTPDPYRGTRQEPKKK